MTVTIKELLHDCQSLLVIGTAVGTVLLYAVGADIWFLIKYLRQRLREREERERQREREKKENVTIGEPHL